MEGPEIQFAEATIDNGKFGTRTVRFETGRLAKQAGGAVAAYLDDDTMLLSTTTAGRSPKDQFDFFPLTVDVEERMYAAGKIPGSFFRREGRPSTDAILTCRLIDRPLRPTFTKGLRNEVQVVITVLALNPDHQYDVLAINAASASTQISGLPFSGPIGGVRVGAHRRPVGRVPELQRRRALGLRHGRRRPRREEHRWFRRRRDHDGRGRVHRRDLGPGQERGRPGADRGGRGRGPRGLQEVHRRAVQGPGRARRAGRQAGPGLPDLPGLPGRRLRRRRGRHLRRPDRCRCTIAGKQERETRIDEIKDAVRPSRWCRG